MFVPCQEEELAKSFVTVIILLQAGIGAVLYNFSPFALPLGAVLAAHSAGQPLDEPPVLCSVELNSNLSFQLNLFFFSKRWTPSSHVHADFSKRMLCSPSP